MVIGVRPGVLRAPWGGGSAVRGSGGACSRRGGNGFRGWGGREGPGIGETRIGWWGSSSVAQGARLDQGSSVDGGRGGVCDGGGGNVASLVLAHLEENRVQEIGAPDSVVETMNGQDVAADHELPEEITDVEAPEIDGRRVGVIAVRRRTPDRGGRSVGPEDAHAVEVGRKATGVTRSQLVRNRVV